jgi:hypothetical protein
VSLTPQGVGLFFVSMPYKKVKNHPECSADKPIGVVKSDDGKLKGCHPSDEAANKQLAALNINEGGTKAGKQPEEWHMGDKLTYTRALPDTTEVRAEDLLKDTSLPVPFIASTEGVKSDGKDLRMSDWDLSAYERYGPIFWVHDYMHPPLGTGDARTDDKLRVDVTFDQDDPFAMLIRGKAIKGMMAGSVGWETTKDKRNILKEFSMVPMGLDPDSLPEIQRMGLRAMQSEIMGLLDEDADKSLTAYLDVLRTEMMNDIKSTLEAMVVADQEEAEENEEDIQRDDAPEIEESEEEEASEELAELDLERAGSMLSKKNKEDLRKALELIQGVLDRATPDEVILEFEPFRGEEEDEDEEPAEVIESVEQRGQEQEQDEETESDLSPDILSQIKAVLN